MIVLAAISWPAAAQNAPFCPRALCDAAIPTLRQVVGHDPRTENSTPDQIGQSGRPRWLLVIGSPDRIARLDAVKADLRDT